VSILGALTKQIGAQALESLRPPDLSTIADSLLGQKPAPPPPSSEPGAIVVSQIQAMQNACKEDQELAVYCNSGTDLIRVLEVFAPSWKVLVLTGIDLEKTITRVICPIEGLQLTCKVVPAPEGTKPARIRFVVPKPKPE
jgi:hypothetical protein